MNATLGVFVARASVPRDAVAVRGTGRAMRVAARGARVHGAGEAATLPDPAQPGSPSTPGFPPDERWHLLRQPRIGPGVISQLETLGIDSIAALARNLKACDSVEDGSLAGRALLNRRQALRLAVESWTDASSGKVAPGPGGPAKLVVAGGRQA
jgi:hypothetical protein